MTKPAFQLTVLGCRGSMAVCRDDFKLFGGDTSCYMVQADDETIFLDAGTGICAAPAAFPKAPVILLSHLHLDHVIGMGMYPGHPPAGEKTRLFVPFCRDGEEAQALFSRIFTPPFWPVPLEECLGGAELLPVPSIIEIGPVRVDSMPGNHPGGSLIYRLGCRGKTIVYATDYEHGEPSFSELVVFSRDADLILYDAQFDEAEYEAKKGYGHSTPEKGLELLERSGAKRLLLTHHNLHSSDSCLLAREEKLAGTRASYARQGQVIRL